MRKTPITPLTQPISTQTNHRNGDHDQNGAAQTAYLGAIDDTQDENYDERHDGRFVSEEEYWALWYENGDVSYEWNDGYLEAKPLSNQLQFRLYKWFLILLEHYLLVYQTGQMMGLETGFVMRVPSLHLPGQLKRTIRKPDIAVIRHDNAVQWGEIERSYRGICDLCIESLSDSTKGEVARDTKTKKTEYEFAGVQEYYILDPAGVHMHFYQRTPANTYVEILPDAIGIIRSLILPGFQFRISDLYRLPTLEMLALDPVYQAYILPHYRAALTEAEEARRRVVVEVAARQAVETENARLQEEIARLRKGAL